MKIRNAVVLSATLLSAVAGLTSRVEAGPPALPNLAPLFPFRNGSYANNFTVTNRLGGPTLEFEILTANIGGQDWVRPPNHRADCCGIAPCHSGNAFFRMPQTHEYTIYWWDPDLQQWTLIDQRRKTTICIQDDFSRGNDPQLNCLQTHGTNFPCQCDSVLYGPGTGNGVSKGWADSYFRGLAGQWAFIGDYRGDFALTTELDPDWLLQPDGRNMTACQTDDDCAAPETCCTDPIQCNSGLCLNACQSDSDCADPLICNNGFCNFLDRERDATHDDDLSIVYFHYEGGLGSVDPVTVVYNFAPVCTF